MQMVQDKSYTIIGQKFLNRQFIVDRTIVMVVKPCMPLLTSLVLHILS